MKTETLLKIIGALLAMGAVSLVTYRIGRWWMKRRFKCPDCGVRYKSYWDGHDCHCGKIHLCGRCYNFNHKTHDHPKPLCQN